MHFMQCSIQMVPRETEEFEYKLYFRENVHKMIEETKLLHYIKI